MVVVVVGLVGVGVCGCGADSFPVWRGLFMSFSSNKNLKKKTYDLV